MSLVHRISPIRAAAAITGLLVTLVGLAPAASATTVSAQLQRATGHSAVQLSTSAACGAATTGYRCYARVLTLSSSGTRVAPLHVPNGAVLSPASSAPQPYTPAFLQSAYDTTWLSASQGATDTVAIVDAYGDPGAYSDMEQFRSLGGLPSLPACGGSVTSSCFERVNQNGQTTGLPTAANDETGEWNIEESLDIDAVSSLCPRCKILMVEANSDDSGFSPDLETAVQTAANMGADQISLSWGADIAPDAAANEWPYSSITSAAVLAAAGDRGYPGASVGYPAALPQITAVGGTSLTTSTAARGYAESTWAGTESGCDTSQTRPTYQSSITTGCAGRGYNDISADADPDTGLAIYDSQAGSEGCGTPDHECIVGGTSLATPLTAAFEAVAGVSDTTPAWTYGSEASLLNDITAGSDGSCPSTRLCSAGTGWDGPTGNGSISGDIVAGGPGIGASSISALNATDVTFSGGVYPNGESTAYRWQYWVSGQSSSSAASTGAATASGSAVASVSSTVCSALTPSTTYDYDLVATNTSGTETGYQGSFTTPATESAPTSAGPSVSGSPTAGQTLEANANWNGGSCNSAPSYAWQEAPTSGGPWRAVATTQSYALGPADVGGYLRFTSSESNGTVPAGITSAVVGPVAATPQTSTTVTLSPTSTTPASGPSTPAASDMSTTPTSSTTSTTSTTVRFYRCARTCTLLNTHGAATYSPRRADYGRYIRIVTTVTGVVAGIRTSHTSIRWLGPITGDTAGAVGIVSGARMASVAVIRGSSGRALASVRVARRGRRRLILTVQRSSRAPTRVWAYVTAGGRVLEATAERSLTRAASLSFTLRRGQTIRLVAVRT